MTPTTTSGSEGNQRVRQLLGLVWLRLVEQIRAVALVACLRRAAAALDIVETDAEDEHAAEQAEPRRGPGRRLEKCGRDDVLDLRRARQSIHREGEGAESDRARNEPLGNVALAEHLRRERIDRKHHHEQRYAAVGQDRADHDDRQHGPFCADQAYHRCDDRLGEP